MQVFGAVCGNVLLENKRGIGLVPPCHLPPFTCWFFKGSDSWFLKSTNEKWTLISTAIYAESMPCSTALQLPGARI